MHRCGRVAAGAIALLVLLAPPAFAHTGASQPTDYLARVTRPLRIDGVAFRIVESGAKVEVTNRSAHPLTVLGYEDEPYLRVERGGVFENINSPAVYLNASRSGGDASKPPRWRRIGNGPTARWHDHRVHWMAGDPASVSNDRGHRHRVARWLIPVRTGSRTTEVRGVIDYVPGPTVWPWLAAALVLAALTYLGRRPVTLVLALVSADVARTIATGSVAVLGVGGWILAVAAVLLRRRRIDGTIAAGLAGVVLAIVGGVLPWSDLRHSQVAVPGSLALLRVVATACAGLGVGLAANAWRSVRE
jgi:hypothetical protein